MLAYFGFIKDQHHVTEIYDDRVKLDVILFNGTLDKSIMISVSTVDGTARGTYNIHKTVYSGGTIGTTKAISHL